MYKRQIVDFAVLDDKDRCTITIEKSSSFRIRMKVVFHHDIQEPIIAYTCKDIKGTEITGTNTLFEKKSVEHSQACLLYTSPCWYCSASVS